MTEEPLKRGRLAQVIASRGGLAPPEAPFVIEHREALIYMLCQAAELEHGIMCQYLYAAFSLKQSRDEGLSAEEDEPGAGCEPAVSDGLAEIQSGLAGIADALAAHLPARYGLQTPAPGRTPTAVGQGPAWPARRSLCAGQCRRPGGGHLARPG